MGSADICHDPICGVCDWNGKPAKKNIYDGKEAAWAFKRLKDDLYLIMNRAENNLRCLGFESKDAPYPSLITYSQKPKEDAEGTCWIKATAKAPAKQAVDSAKKAIKCSAEKPCAAKQKCRFGVSMVGSWSQDLKGGTDPANYFCGFNDASAVRTNGAAVWSVHALGCRGKWCEKRLFDNQFTLRSLARAVKDPKNADSYECLYFPQSFVGQTSNPMRVPRLGAKKNPGSAFGWRDEDNSKDPDCGIRLAQHVSTHENCKCVNGMGTALEHASEKACKDGSKTNHWVCNDNTAYSQERALIANQQATWKLIFLNEFERAS